jgi:membrane peptidoglycan carboxypeptidase
VWWHKRRVAKKRRLARMSRKRRVFRRIGIIGTWLLGLVAAITVTGVVLLYTLGNVPKPSDLPLPQVATIYYADGSVMARIGTVNRTSVSLDQVPKQVRWDVLAAEDRNFYSEPGISIKGTIRAALSDLTGGDTQGGSGITQQYAKNAYLSNEQSLSRKIKELAIAVKLSHDYSRDQILEYYLNTVYFGRGTYGIQAAAQTFFGKDVSKLTVSEGALLAGLLRAPSYYDPAVNPAESHARWQYVIDGMVATKHLTPAQAAALRFPKVLPQHDSRLGASGPTALIVHQVVQDLEAHGISEKEINARGLRITTTIERKAQADAVRAIDTTFAHLTAKQRNYKNALVAVDPASGGVVAYYGGPNGKDYAGKVDNFDYAGVGTRPPGSSFKPYTLATVLSQTLDKTHGKPRLTLNSKVNGSYCVHIEGVRICNDPSDRPYSSSKVSIRNAMKYSLNTTFDLLAAQAGPDNVAAIAHRVGIPEKDSSGKPTLVGANGHTGFGIGIGDYPISPLAQAVGYASFANGGMRNDAYFVSKVTDASGKVLYEHSKKPARALDAKVANDVTLSLQPVAGWSGVPLADGRVSAAKTGTEGILDDPNGNNSDAWMVGYTPQVTAAVWAGSGNSTTPIYAADGRPEYGRDLPGKAWQRFMNAYLAGAKKLPMATKMMVTNGNEHKQHTSTPPPATRVPSREPASSSSAPPSTSSAPPTTSSAPPTTSSPPPTPPPTTSSRPPTSSAPPPPTSSIPLRIPSRPGP